jgi:hypothetical protein
MYLALVQGKIDIGKNGNTPIECLVVEVAPPLADLLEPDNLAAAAVMRSLCAASPPRCQPGCSKNGMSNYAAPGQVATRERRVI